MASNFTSVPVLDYSLIRNGHKDKFILQLRHALIWVGFLYLLHPPVDKELVDELVAYIPELFALPQDKKDAILMQNSPHFLGYSRLGAEFTKGVIDQREQFDFATTPKTSWRPGDPEYRRLCGEAQWPEENDIPGFKATMLKYLSQFEQLSEEFTTLLAEALGLPPDGLSPYFTDEPSHHSASNGFGVQHRVKIVKYPAAPLPDPASTSASDPDSNSKSRSSSDDNDQAQGQGVGPHFDSGFLTFLLQASPHAGLQVQNLSGEWIGVPPLDDTFVVNIGKGLEVVTMGIARATSHRVLSPAPGSTPRYSVPFFQRISMDVRLTEHIPQFPPEIIKLRNERGALGQTASVNYMEYGSEPTGRVELIGRIKSHPDVAERYYPELFKKLFPNGMPAQAQTY